MPLLLFRHLCPCIKCIVLYFLSCSANGTMLCIRDQCYLILCTSLSSIFRYHFYWNNFVCNIYISFSEMWLKLKVSENRYLWTLSLFSDMYLISQISLVTQFVWNYSCLQDIWLRYLNNRFSNLVQFSSSLQCRWACSAWMSSSWSSLHKIKITFWDLTSYTRLARLSYLVDFLFYNVQVNQEY